MNLKERISVIIRSKNEERWIGHCIQSVIEFLDKPEIIIVDNNSSDETIPIIKSFKEDPNFKVKKITTQKLKFYQLIIILREEQLIQVKNAKNKFVLVISAHCTIKKINLNKHLKDLKKFKCVSEIKFQFGKEKKLQKDIFGVILLTNLW